MNKKLRNTLFFAGLLSFLISIFVVFQFKKNTLQNFGRLSSRTLQSSINLKFYILTRQVLRFAKMKTGLQNVSKKNNFTDLSQSSIKFLAVLNLKNFNKFSWFTANSYKFSNQKVIKKVLKKSNLYLSKSIKKSTTAAASVFPIKILNQQYFILAAPYKEGNSFLWALAVLPKLSFISWLPINKSTEPFSILNSSSDIISHSNYSYVAKKNKSSWAARQNQLGLLESQNFNYKNFDFNIQMFSKIEKSSLLLSSNFKMYFWPMFFKLLFVFTCIFVLLPKLFLNKKNKLKVKDFYEEKQSKKDNIKSPHQNLPASKDNLKNSYQNLSASKSNLSQQKKETSLLNDQEELISLQELPAHSSIIKDLKNLIDDLDKKPLSSVDSNQNHLTAKKEQEL
ncbi:MAG: hypothetical protein HAW60_03235 [Bdellovibrionales bacterium]|nr:hypothetical protein [Bdellovibrionales bacterium]